LGLPWPLARIFIAPVPANGRKHLVEPAHILFRFHESILSHQPRSAFCDPHSDFRFDAGSFQAHNRDHKWQMQSNIQGAATMAEATQDDLLRLGRFEYKELTQVV